MPMTIFTSAWVASPRTMPAGHAAYAIGDVHGCLAELRLLVAHLRGHVLDPARRNTLVLIGDYIDRGPASLDTLSYLDDLALPGVAIVRLLGNHDFFLKLIVGEEEIDAAFVEFWLDVGGSSTFRELGFTRDDLYRMPLAELRTAIRRRLGARRVAVLGGLALSHRVADLLFVHAGLDPALALEAHDPSDLVMIREPFLSGTGWRHDVTVVHGHTIRGHEVLPHRIAVDTGAFRTGILSCVEIVENRLRWIAATGAGNLDGLASLPRTGPDGIAYEEFRIP